MPQHPITITCLAYKSLRTIREAVASVWNQDYDGVITILIREQGGDTEELAAINELANMLGSSHNRRIVVTSGENLGFAVGHNMLFRESKDPFVLALNSDAVLTPSYLSEAMPLFSDEAVGAIQGKLLRLNTETLSSPIMGGNPPAPIIDTTGLVPLKNRRIVNRGQGEEDRGQYNKTDEVWGADGAAPIYRRKALDDVAIPCSISGKERPPEAGADAGRSPEASPEVRNRTEDAGELREYFDEDFFAYKEDVDLAWRLRWRGWKTIYAPKAVAWHGRGAGENAATKYRAIILERQKISPLLKYYSFSNQRLLLLKNEDFKQYITDLPKWIIKEVGAWGYALLFERRTIPAIIRILKLMPRTIKKRRWIMSRRAKNANPYKFFT